MPVIPIIFKGRLNLDDNLSLLPEGDFIEALNITRDQISAQRDLAVSNLVGNQLRRTVANPTGTTVTIGAKADSVRNRVYNFNWNSDGYHRIEYMDGSSFATVLLLEDDPVNPVLDFDVNDKIIDIDIVYRDEGDLLYWNQRELMPRKLNVATALSGNYSPFDSAYFEAAKRPPLFPPLSEYLTDTNIKVNNLKGKFFEFAYRFVYDDFEKSTFSPLSSAALTEFNYLAALNPVSNNALQITVDTGDKFVEKIEVAFRYNIGNNYSDYSLIVSLDKSELGIGDDSTYQFIFGNDGAYPPINVIESLNYYDFVPRKANAQCLPNGNYLSYGGITEGYDGLTTGDLDVTAVVTYESVPIPSGVVVIGNPQLSYIDNGVFPPRYTFTVGATVTPGDQYRLATLSGPTFDFTYTAILGDDRDDVANYFVTQINPLAFYTATFIGSGQFEVVYSALNQSSTYIELTAATSAAGAGAFFDRIYKAGGKFRFAQIYFDEQGRVIGNPVNTYVTAPGDQNDYEVEINEFYATATDYIRPVVELTVRHLPPPEAKSFAFLRTNNLLVQSFFEFKTNHFEIESGFWYISVQPVIDYIAATPNFSSQWTYQEGDRIKIIYKFNGANASGWDASYSPIIDAPIVGVVLKTFTPDPERSYIKIQAYPGTVTPTPDDNLVFEVYRPSVKTSETQQIYYEFGETYECVVIDGINYHEGQNSTTNPTFEFSDGDVYIRLRSGVGDDYLILDPNFSDFYASAVNSNGRNFIVDENAKETYNPVLVRFSQAYQFGTNINGLNRFYEENFDEYNRSFGDIRKLAIRSSYMQVFQMFRIGRVGVFQQILKDQDGNDNLTISDRLLNTIVYYVGDYGTNAPESFATNNYASYFCDNIRGVVGRLSLDGIEPISILYKINSFATAQLPLRTGNSKIYGVFNAQTNRYEFAMEATEGSAAFTMAFDEINNSFEGERSYQPEWMVCLGTLMITYKNGTPYTHDSTTFNNFFGVQYPSNISAVANAGLYQKKTWISLLEIANTTWVCPLIYTSLMSYGSQRQESNLILEDFRLLEDQPSVSFKRDIHSPGGIINGNVLKGTWIVIKFEVEAARTEDLVALSAASVKFIDSPLNVRN